VKEDYYYWGCEAAGILHLHGTSISRLFLTPRDCDSFHDCASTAKEAIDVSESPLATVEQEK
jgi:hypothetical protein